MEPHWAPSPLEMIIMVINCIAQKSLFFSNIWNVILLSRCTGGQEKRVCTREQQLNLARESVNRDWGGLTWAELVQVAWTATLHGQLDELFLFNGSGGSKALPQLCYIVCMWGICWILERSFAGFSIQYCIVCKWRGVQYNQWLDCSVHDQLVTVQKESGGSLPDEIIIAQSI